ncbi:D-alanyl-D-alanine carboxypeptidase [Streptomyces sp. NPDC091271]|uniref:D-alanyl-D-alanine carboxypeptidase n=1 Tax=Streptomyces sp. NPDC091271 TaxID=3365980 RepID=UPI0038004597
MSPRLIKEVSVAGESPDKSEQRKSSGTAEERDPRLAVFRGPVAAADGSTTDGATGTAKDSETAVFRLPHSAEADASGGASGASEGAEGPERASTPREAAGEAEKAEDAAGEATAAPEAPSSTSSEETRPDSDAEGESDSGRSDAGADSDAEGESDSGRSDAGADSGSEREEVAEPASEAPSAPDAASGTDTDGADSDGGSETGSEAGSTPTDARLRAAVAAWVATGPEEEAAGRSSAAEAAAEPSEDDDKAPGSSGEAPAVTEEKAESADDETPADTDVTPADDDSSADDAAETAAAPAAETAAAPAAEASTGSDAEVPAGCDAKATAGSDAKATADSDADESDDAEETAEAEASEDAAESAEAKDDAPATRAPDDAPRIPKTRAEVSPAEEADSARDERGIDHPTAVFKAPRAEQIDHPTTALKLPPKEKAAARKPASWAAKASGAPEAPEAPAERTSKFVPLRSDDVRPAPVVGPTVTPDVTAGPGSPASPGAGIAEAERTRQQPMPPRPPLDLLAELTNTPPPPETPVRTAVRRVKIWTPLLLLVLVIFAIAQAMRPLPDPTLTLSASPTYTFGGEKLAMPWPEDGQGAVEVEGVGTIGTYGKEKSAPIASVAKIMTAYVILQGHPITGKQAGDQIVVDAKAGEEANRPDESTAPIKEGQKYTERQMLQLLMIPSGNNVARLLARWDADTEKAFVEKMNAAAEDLGMTNSVYTDPSGLEATTRSTPADQLKLAKAVMQNDVFREIVNMPQAEIPGIGKTIYNNNNILLEPGVSGIKTGSSTPAGGNLIWTADTVIDGKTRRIIGAVMGADVDGTLDAKLQRALQSSLALIQTAQEGVDSATVVKKGQIVGYVDNGFGGQTPVVATKDLKAVGWGGLEVDLKLTDGGKAPAHTAKAGTVVGEVTVGTGTGKVSAPVALQSEMTEPGFGDKLTRIT